jgi:hypothetical protein
VYVANVVQLSSGLKEYITRQMLEVIKFANLLCWYDDVDHDNNQLTQNLKIICALFKKGSILL